MLKTFIYLNKIPGLKKTYLMTKKVFMHDIVWVYSYDLQSIDGNSTLWKYKKIQGLLGLSKTHNDFLRSKEKVFVEAAAGRVVLPDTLSQKPFYWVLHSLLYFCNIARVF